MASETYLTKTAFSAALECTTKLYYRRNRDKYADSSIDDPFLQALAEGGFQVGELAKFLFCEDPYNPDITVRELSHAAALRITSERFEQRESVVIAEAAFSFENLFVRTDILTRNGIVVDIYEVKSKSFDSVKDEFEPKGPGSGISSHWRMYLYDVAFQKYVVSRALAGRGFIVRSHVVLVDKERTATVDGLNQLFKIQRAPNGHKIASVKRRVTKADLGAKILTVINVDDIVERIWKDYPVPTDFLEEPLFEEFVHLCAESCVNNTRLFSPIGKKCKDCEYRVTPEATSGKRSGFNECWKQATKLEEDALAEDLVLDLWGGGLGSRSAVHEQIEKGVFLLKQVDPSDFEEKKSLSDPHAGMTANERRIEQIRRTKSGSRESYLNSTGLAAEMESWEYPLHMIDFETACPALPFHKGLRPYEGIAFQFSHHTLDQDGTVRHAGQFLSFEPGVFPNYEFVRALKKELAESPGTIFRYHNHENTYLNHIFRQLEHDPDPPEDKKELQDFIREITTWEEEIGGRKRKMAGSRNMVDLYQAVRSYYYPPQSKGSISIKAILPSMIADSDYLRAKYSKPVYGRNKPVHSLNFDEHIWIEERFQNDPYKSLPPLFPGYDNDLLDAMLKDFEEIADGGAAMTAYNYLQFSDLPAVQREELRGGLLRYCELDTMAMVMIVEGWREMLAH